MPVTTAQGDPRGPGPRQKTRVQGARGHGAARRSKTKRARKSRRPCVKEHGAAIAAAAVVATGRWRPALRRPAFQPRDSRCPSAALSAPRRASGAAASLYLNAQGASSRALYFAPEPRAPRAADAHATRVLVPGAAWKPSCPRRPCRSTPAPRAWRCPYPAPAWWRRRSTNPVTRISGTRWPGGPPRPCRSARGRASCSWWLSRLRQEPHDRHRLLAAAVRARRAAGHHAGIRHVAAPAVHTRAPVRVCLSRARQARQDALVLRSRARSPG